MSHLSAIDIGFWNNKAIIDGKPIKFKSVVGTSRQLKFSDFDMSVNAGDKIISDGMFLSDLAIAQSDSVEHSLKPNRFNSVATAAIIKATFAIGFGNGNFQTYLVSGLPVSHYTKYKEEIKSLFLGDGTSPHPFNYDVMYFDKQIKGNAYVLGAKFIPQPFGALLDRLLDEGGNVADPELAKKTIAVIDIGFGTTDIYVSNSLRPIDRLTFSTPIAMNHAYSLITNKIEEYSGALLPLYKIEQIAREGSWKGKSLQEEIKWAFNQTANQLTAVITNKLISNMHEIEMFLVAGGGGNAIGNLLDFDIPDNGILGDMAVVNGYNKWGRRTWKIGGVEGGKAVYLPNNAQNNMA